MKKTLIKTVIVIGASFLLAPLAYANSYLDMITKAPKDYISTQTKYIPTTSNHTKPNTWYDSKISTKSPIVTSPYPKYLAWRQSKAIEDRYYNYKEDIQEAIYILETIALCSFIHKILDN